MVQGGVLPQIYRRGKTGDFKMGKKPKVKDFVEMSMIPVFGGATMGVIQNSGIDQPYRGMLGTVTGAGLVNMTHKKMKKLGRF